MAGYALLESMFPGVAIARRLQERGETPYDDSTVFSPKSKAGTAHGGPGLGAALDRVLNPLRPTYLHPQQSSTVSGAPVPRGPVEKSMLSPRQQEAVDRAFKRLEGGGLSRRQQELLDRAFARMGG